ncbi:MAG TPA: Mur ligase family protein, partial [Gemmatimonadales bacterium]|nr:Mur ligase family protein [Gemmatimonadales bacterium]
MGRRCFRATERRHDVPDLRPGPRVPLSPYDDHQVRARHHACPAPVAGEPARRRAGDPHRGTNGKGSVCTLVAAALREAGWRVGLYTSPHLVSFRERIQVDGVPISEDAVAMWTERLRPLILERRATFFEATTAIAFADFAARGAEIAVVEVGLGGRLDSTNVVRPLVSAVTKIERDHMKYLGDTLERIAGEKAGIA